MGHLQRVPGAPALHPTQDLLGVKLKLQQCVSLSRLRCVTIKMKDKLETCFSGDPNPIPVVEMRMGDRHCLTPCFC